MSAAFRNCILGSVARGVINRDQGDEILQRYDRETAANGGDGLKAKAKIAADLSVEAQERRRREILATKAAQRIAEDVRGYRGADGKADVVSAITRLFDNVGHTGYESVVGRFNALFSAATTEMLDAFHLSRRNLFLQRKWRDGVNPRDVVRAAFGENASPGATAYYAAFVSPAEKLRDMFNAAGGAIGWREDWGLPTRHDSGALLNAGFGRWRDFINPFLDWEHMRHPATDTPILPSEYDDVLRHVWRSVVMDGWNTRSPARNGSGRASMANSRSDPRFLKFKDATSWSAYNREFGFGDDIHGLMAAHLRGMAKDVAAMQILGPNPAATTQWLKQIIAQDRARAAAGDPSLFRPSRTAIINPESIVDTMYEFVRGGAQPTTMMGRGVDRVVNVASNYEMGAKLGSAPIAHLATNPVLQSFARFHYGLPQLGMISGMLRSMGSAGFRDEVSRMGFITDDVTRSLERGAREQAVWNRMVQASRVLPAFTTHYSGLDGLVTSLRRAWWWSTSGTVTDLLGKSFSEIPERNRMLLEGFGIDEHDWNVMRTADLHVTESGTPMLRFGEIAQAGVDKPDQVREALGLPADASPAEIAQGAENTSLKYLGMLHQSMEFGVPSNRLRARASMQGGAAPGTPAGVFLRSANMFKGFGAAMTISHFEAIRREISRNATTGAAYAGSLAIMLTAMNLLSIQAKQVSNGKDLLPMDPTTPEGRATLARATLMGGFAIFGDFLASELDSYGHGFADAVSGPIITDLGDLGLSALRAVVPGRASSRVKSAAEQRSENVAAARRLAQNNTTFLSTHWLFRAAYNRIVLDQLQYLADPSAHQLWRKNEQRLQKDTGQSYYWPPGEMAPARPPQLTPGRP